MFPLVRRQLFTGQIVLFPFPSCIILVYLKGHLNTLSCVVHLFRAQVVLLEKDVVFLAFQIPLLHSLSLDRLYFISLCSSFKDLTAGSILIRSASIASYH